MSRTTKKDQNERNPWELHLDQPVNLNRREIEALNEEIQYLIYEAMQEPRNKLRMDLLLLCRLADIGRQYLESRKIKSLIIDSKELLNKNRRKDSGG